jgi:hypothetical protein
MPKSTTEIQVHSEAFQALKYRRNYEDCRHCDDRSGTLIFSAEPIAFTFREHVGHLPVPDQFKRTEEVQLLVVCEKCGQRWVPSKGPALRALGL